MGGLTIFIVGALVGGTTKWAYDTGKFDGIKNLFSRKEADETPADEAITEGPAEAAT